MRDAVSTSNNEAHLARVFQEYGCSELPSVLCKPGMKGPWRDYAYTNCTHTWHEYNAQTQYMRREIRGFSVGHLLNKNGTGVACGECAPSVTLETFFSLRLGHVESADRVKSPHQSP